jgi:2-(1,2-epoxy-1,2-dihydrophenyl)acetyl-CoA isomerase
MSRSNGNDSTSARRAGGSGPWASPPSRPSAACDLRYAVDDAILTTAFARVGLAGDYGGAWLLAHLIGVGRAKELFYFSEKLSAADAERLGVVNAVFSREAFESEVMNRAKTLASGPALAYRYMKENINRSVLGEFGESMDVEVTHHIHSSLTEDHREASRAFVEKREPTFRGR